MRFAQRGQKRQAKQSINQSLSDWQRMQKLSGHSLSPIFCLNPFVKLYQEKAKMEAEYNECCNKIKEKGMKQDMWMNGIEKDLSDVICRVDKLELGERYRDSALQEENKRLLQLRKELEGELIKCQMNSACSCDYNAFLSEINRVSAKCSDLEKELDELTKQNDRLLTAREANINELDKLTEEKQKLCLELDQAIRKIKKIDNLEAENEMLKEANAFAKNHIEKLETEKHHSGFAWPGLGKRLVTGLREENKMLKEENRLLKRDFYY